MSISKEWDWKKGSEDEWWFIPAEDVYYYVSRWKEKDFVKFLDLGCGIGRHSILFAQNGFDVYSFDLSETGINMLMRSAEKQNLKIHTRIGDMNNLPYETNTFDCLLAYHVISHTDSVGIKHIINEICRVLKPDGEFFISLCSKESPTYKNGNFPKLDENTILKTDGPEVNVPHYYSDVDSVRELLKDIKIIRLRHIQDFFDNCYGWHYFVHGKVAK
ncbi:MAG: class I SAM-dependent methyltransferase [Bacillota bacterium]